MMSNVIKRAVNLIYPSTVTLSPSSLSLSCKDAPGQGHTSQPVYMMPFQKSNLIEFRVRNIDIERRARLTFGSLIFVLYPKKTRKSALSPRSEESAQRVT